jgi:hypothetical protein
VLQMPPYASGYPVGYPGYFPTGGAFPPGGTFPPTAYPFGYPPAPPPTPEIPVVPVPAPPPETQESQQLPISVYLHVCATCGIPRSRGFHRDNPIIPGVPQQGSDCKKCRDRKQKEQEMMEARNYTSSGESDSDRRPNKGRKTEGVKAKKKVQIIVHQGSDSSGSEEEAVVIKKVSQHQHPAGKNKGKGDSAQPFNCQGQASGYQQPTGPGLPQHHGFIPGVAYPIPDNDTGNPTPAFPCAANLPRHVLSYL